MVQDLQDVAFANDTGELLFHILMKYLQTWIIAFLSYNVSFIMNSHIYSKHLNMFGARHSFCSVKYLKLNVEEISASFFSLVNYQQTSFM